MAGSTLVVKIVGDASALDRTFRGVESRSQKFSNKMQAKGGFAGGLLGGGIGKAGVIGAAVAAGSAVAITALKKVTDAAKEAQVAQAGLNQAFASAGVTSGKAKKNVDASVQAVSKLAGIDDEEVSRNFANLLRTTGSVAKATKDVGLAANIARARNISLAAATKVVEKAETGQLRGLKAVGVQIDKNTTSAEAIDRAQRKFAGSAEAYGKTAQGAQDRLRVSFENVEEQLGQKLLPIITKISLKLIDFIDWSEQNWPRFSKAIGKAYRDAKPFIDATIHFLTAVSNEVIGMVKIVHGVLTGDWKEAWKGFKQVALDGILGVVKAVAELPAKLVSVLSRRAFAGLEKVGGYIGDAILDGLKSVLNKAIDLINDVIRKVNKVGGVLNKALPGNPVGKIPQVGRVGTTAGRTATPVLRSERQFSPATGGTIVVTSPDVLLDGKKISTNTRNHNIIHGERNPPQKRGR